MSGLIPLKLVRIWQIRNIGTFLPSEYGMEKWFVRQMQREGHLEFNGAGYYSITESSAKALEAFRLSLIKMDKAACKAWEE